MRHTGPSKTLREVLELAIVDIQRSRSGALHHVDPQDAAAYAAIRQRQMQGPRKCTICADEGHNHSDCNKSCKSCGMRRCPGARAGQKCAVLSKERPNQLTDALGQKMSSDAYADILAAWRLKNPKEAEADKHARREARQSRRTVRTAEDDQEDLSDQEPMPGEDYGVLVASRRLHNACQEDSDSDTDIPRVSTLSWSPVLGSVGADNGATMPAVHAAQATNPTHIRQKLMIDSGASIHLFQTNAMRSVAGYRIELATRLHQRGRRPNSYHISAGRGATPPRRGAHINGGAIRQSKRRRRSDGARHHLYGEAIQRD